jgi:hypothetical protein
MLSQNPSILCDEIRQVIVEVLKMSCGELVPTEGQMFFPQADVNRGALRELFLAVSKKFKLTGGRCWNSKIHFLMIAQKILSHRCSLAANRSPGVRHTAAADHFLKQQF